MVYTVFLLSCLLDGMMLLPLFSLSCHRDTFDAALEVPNCRFSVYCLGVEFLEEGLVSRWRREAHLVLRVVAEEHLSISRALPS